MRRTSWLAGSLLQTLKNNKLNNGFFTSLWNKPQTRDERVKEYVPEVLEESMAEQRAVLQENTARDVMVELGHKVLQEIENKSPTPSIAPSLNRILASCDAADLITQRPLSYLLYPSSFVMHRIEQPHELIANFADNFRSFIEEVERAGLLLQPAKPAVETAGGGEAKSATSSADDKRSSSGGSSASTTATATTKADEVTVVPGVSSGDVIMTRAENYESMEVTMFVKMLSAMSLANMHCGDMRNAVRCVDVALKYVKDQQRLGGLLGMKAGLLVHQKRLTEAVECAMKAIEASGNVQGYLHGGYALRLLRRQAEAVQLLEKGCTQHPMNMTIADMLRAAQQELKPALPESSATAIASSETPTPRIEGNKT